MSDYATEVFITLILLSLTFGGIALWKGCAPQSGFKSRFGGKPVELKRPADLAEVINMGKTGDVKLLVYRTKDGKVKMREYSDFGILEAEYVVADSVEE
jgi:hypothetical protein